VGHIHPVIVALMTARPPHSGSLVPIFDPAYRAYINSPTSEPTSRNGLFLPAAPKCVESWVPRLNSYGFFIFDRSFDDGFWRRFISHRVGLTRDLFHTTHFLTPLQEESRSDLTVTKLLMLENHSSRYKSDFRQSKTPCGFR